ncbi:MAG: arginine repressor [Myxococcales bacterium]|nr:arginine repressor [Myxococcales bacterium]
MSETKERRKILRQLLLAGRGGSTQAQLVAALADRGVSTTQSTISRDLKLLGAQRRVREDGNFVYRLESGSRSSFPAGMVLAVHHNETMVVIRTRVGRAPAVGLELDGLRHPDILGTIAGDDTVLVIPGSVTRVDALARALTELAELA